MIAPFTDLVSPDTDAYTPVLPQHLPTPLLDPEEMENNVDEEQDNLSTPVVYEDETEFTDNYDSETIWSEFESPVSNAIENTIRPVYAKPAITSATNFLPAEKNARVTAVNKSQLQKAQLSASQVLAALDKYVDIRGISGLLLKINASNSGASYSIVSNGTEVDAVFTEAMHQFQIANFIDVKEHDGIAGLVTLDTLGFWQHNLRPKLSSSGFYGQAQLSKLKDLIPAATNQQFNASNWYKSIMYPAWLGVKITKGVHLVFLRSLRATEAHLLAQPKYTGLTPAAVGKALGFDAASYISGARLSAEKQAMHGFGLAIDIESSKNPWIGAGWIKDSAEGKRLIEVFRKAAGNASLPGFNVFEYLNSIATSAGSDSSKAYNILKQRNSEFISYLNQNKSERAFWEKSRTFQRNSPLKGFLSHHHDLVWGLRQISKLAWGAIDFGPRASGDIMHYDMRTIGIGKIICEAIGGYVPKIGNHPAIQGEIADLEHSPDHDDEINFEFEHHEAIEEAFDVNNELLSWEEGEDYLSNETGEAVDYPGEWEDSQNTREEESDYSYGEMNQLVADVSKAVKANRYYATALGWQPYHSQINDLLLPFSGQQNVSLGEEDFVHALYEWQRKNGFSDKEADGIIGPKTWARLKPFVVPSSGNASPSPPQSGNTSDRGGEAGDLQHMKFGTLVIDTSNPALSKSYPHYQFTSGDALWLARFVEGEAGGHNNAESHAVIWAMFNRFGLLRHRVSSWTSFAVFLRKYSTTLQPLLNSSGAAQRVWDNHRRDPAANPVISSDETYPGTQIKKVQYQRHIKLQQKAWSAFPSYLRDMVIRILKGQIPNPGIGIATDFDSTYVFLKASRRKKGITAEPSHEEWVAFTIQHARQKKVIWIGEKTNLNQKKNAFYIQPLFKNVPAGAVRIEFDLVPVNELEDVENMEEWGHEYHTAEEDYLYDNEFEVITDWSRAVTQNRYYAGSLGWSNYYNQINNLLLPLSGMHNVSLSEDAFAMALAKWQAQQGFSPGDCDGILGPQTWKLMRPLVAVAGSQTAIKPVTQTGAPPVQNIAAFNQWHAQKILDAVTAGVVGVNSRLRLNSKSQLEDISRGSGVLNIDPQARIIQILPVLHHICEQARSGNFKDILIGSFIREPDSNGACSGHCAGRCIDINCSKGSFDTNAALQMVINILQHLTTMPARYKMNMGFGLPVQGNFFRDRNLAKFKGTSLSNIVDPQLRQLVSQLGIVFPDNDNHLHIQVRWM